MDGGRTLFLQLPREKAIDIEFEDVAFSVSEGRKGKDGAGVLIVWEKKYVTVKFLFGRIDDGLQLFFGQMESSWEFNKLFLECPSYLIFGHNDKKC
jgi:hypothetical protein